MTEAEPRGSQTGPMTVCKLFIGGGGGRTPKTFSAECSPTTLEGRLTQSDPGHGATDGNTPRGQPLMHDCRQA